MIPITPFAWRQSVRKAPASIACTRQSSSAGKGPSVRPGPALITPITCPGPRRRRRRQRNRRPRRQENPRVATTPTTRFAWNHTVPMAASSSASIRRWNSAKYRPQARPGLASATPLTSRHLRRRKPNPHRRPNQPNQPSRRSQRNHRNLRNRSSAERAALIPVQKGGLWRLRQLYSSDLVRARKSP
jgi:hypothetical protein